MYLIMHGILYLSNLCVRSLVLQQILAPFTDFHYRHNADMAEGQLKWVCVRGKKKGVSNTDETTRLLFWHFRLFTVSVFLYW